MGQRHLAREAALGFLYQDDLSIETATLSAELFLKHFFADEVISDLFYRMALGVQASRSDIDEKLQACTEHWKIARLERIDRVILRMGAWELLNEPDTPIRVIIDEAVELAKKFSTTDSAGFVNGVLDQVAKRFREKPDSETEKAFDLEAKNFNP
jgi:transcription antitermination factor NusB